MNIKKLTNRSLRSMLWAACIFFVFAGSFFSIYSKSFAMGTILAFVLGPLILFSSWGKWSGREIDLMQLGVLAVLAILMLIATTFSPSEGNARYLKAFLFNFFAFLIAQYSMRKKNDAARIGFFLFLAFIAIIAFLQISYIFFEFGLDPTRIDAEDYVADDALRFSGVRSIFTNPNDFSLICTMALAWIFYGVDISERVRGVMAALLFLMIVVAASRTCIVISVLLLGIYYLTSRKRLRNFSIVASLLIVALSVFLSLSGGDLSTSYWWSKTETIFSAMSDFYTHGSAGISDESIDFRASGYLQFFKEFYYIGFGSFEAGDYGYFFKRGDLLDKNPHSLMIELSLLFGYVGFLVFFCILYWLYSSLRQGGVGLLPSTLVAVSFFMLTFVSSSVINFPSFWMSLYFIALGSRSRSSRIENREKRLREAQGAI